MRHLYRVSCQCALIEFSSGALIGFSPVLEQLNAALKPEGSHSVVAASHGVNVFAMAFAFAGLLSLMLSTYAKRQAWMQPVALAFTPLSTALSIVFSAVAVATQQVMVAYLLVLPSLAVGLGGLVFVQNVVFVGSWLREGRPYVGAALVGVSLGTGTLLFTLLPGVLIRHFQPVMGLYVYGAIISALGLLGVGMALSSWVAPSQTHKPVAGRHPKDAAAQSTRQPADKSGAVPQLPVPAADESTLITSWGHYLRTLEGSLFTTVYVLTYFTGIGSKGILTAMFLRIFPDLSFYEATVMAALSLTLYVLARSLFPLFGKRMPMALAFAAISLLGSVLFAALPTILRANITAWGFTGVLMVTGAVFAIGTTLLPVIAAQFFDPKLYPMAVGTSSALSIWGSSAGILSSWYLAAGQLSDKHAEPRSLFNNTFYMYAAVYSLCSAATVFFHVRKTSRLRAMVPDEVQQVDPDMPAGALEPAPGQAPTSSSSFKGRSLGDSHVGDIERGFSETTRALKADSDSQSPTVEVAVITDHGSHGRR